MPPNSKYKEIIATTSENFAVSTNIKTQTHPAYKSVWFWLHIAISHEKQIIKEFYDKKFLTNKLIKVKIGIYKEICNQKCYEFWVNDVIPSSSRWARNDKIPSFEITTPGRQMWPFWKPSLPQFCWEISRIFLARNISFFLVLTRNKKTKENAIHIWHSKNFTCQNLALYCLFLE